MAPVSPRREAEVDDDAGPQARAAPVLLGKQNTAWAKFRQPGNA